ncbi:MAG: hypothetical protein AB7S78_05780 [Candidatus Omnitrophota bacterium]
MTDQDKEAKLKEFFEKARKGVLKNLDQKGGTLPLAEMHEYSLNTYLIQHLRFSQMMESFVEEGLVIVDDETQDTIITDAGKRFIE